MTAGLCHLAWPLKESPVQNIHIKRFAKDPTAQGCIEPEDRSWQLVIDAEGFPHLYVRVTFTEEDGRLQHGLLALDDMLPEKVTIKGLMTEIDNSGPLSPEEADAAYAEYVAACAAGTRPPCPR
jgi:hypothetical protein